MFDFWGTETARLNQLIQEGAASRITDERFVELEIQRFKASQRRKEMFDGERYYRGAHDILNRKRTVIGKSGELEPVENLPNNRIVDNQYKKMVNQKMNYLLGKPITIKTNNTAYAKLLNTTFDQRFMRLLKNIGKDSLNGGIGWMFVTCDEQGKFCIKRFKPSEIIPEWRDLEHTVLDCAIRLYEIISYEGQTERLMEKVEVYDLSGIHRYVLEGGHLVPDERPMDPYFFTTAKGQEVGYNWERIPLIPWKSNNDEIPLIKNVKSLQDGLNTILSNFQNNMDEDPRNTIMVLVNYDGENLGEFRRNLATYGAVKVRTVDGSGGDVKTLQVTVNSDNYKAIVEIFKKAIIENAMGYDAKDDRLSGSPNQLNILSMYSDIDLDANEMETEYQASFQELLWFFNTWLFNTGLGDYDSEKVELLFNRNVMVNTKEIIECCQDSVGILSDETIVAKHPWVDDPKAEMKKIQKQRQEEQEGSDIYRDTFKTQM